MNRLFPVILLVFFLFKSAYSQNYTYAWVNDIRIGSAGSQEALASIIDDINSKSDIKFVVLTGSLTKGGTDNQLSLAEHLLNKLKVPYHVLPGRRDLEFSQSAGYKFKKLFKSHNFAFEYQNVEHIGLNTGLIWNRYGHVSIENLKWLSSVLKETPAGREVVLYSSFPLKTGIDNWYKITNSLSHRKIKVIMSAGGKKNEIGNFENIKSAYAKSSPEEKNAWTYNLVTEHPDSLFFTSVSVNKLKRWGIIKKDSAVYKYHKAPAFRDYSQMDKNKTGAELLWSKDIDATLSSALCAGKDRIFVTAENGLIYCINSKGSRVWKHSYRESFAGAPVYAGGELIAGSLQGDLIAIDGNTGSIVQSIGLNSPVTSQLITVKGEYNGRKTNGVIVGTSGGDIYFYEASTFEQIWENHSAHGTINTRPLLIRNRIIYNSGDGLLYCIDASSGIINWKWKDHANLSTPAVFNPVCSNRNVFAVRPEGYLYAVDLMLGMTVWKKDYNAFESLGIGNNKKDVLMKSIKKDFLIISARNGKPIRKINTGTGYDYLRNTPLSVGDNILFCSQDGCIYKIDKKGVCQRLFFMGNSPLLNLIRLDDNIFIAGNKDGKIIAFKLK